MPYASSSADVTPSVFDKHDTQNDSSTTSLSPPNLETPSRHHHENNNMPANFIPLAIVAVKIGASAVVSLAPVAMSRDETDENGQVVQERRRFRDFFKKEFYAKEFARLDKERLHRDNDDNHDEPTIAVSSRPCHKKRDEERSSTSLRNESGASRRISGSGAFYAREFEPLRNERSVSMRRLRN